MLSRFGWTFSPSLPSSQENESAHPFFPQSVLFPGHLKTSALTLTSPLAGLIRYTERMNNKVMTYLETLSNNKEVMI
jgi:hypothetical protein